MTKTRKKISGRYPEDLDALARPIAWNGTVSQAERERAESDLRDLLVEIREALMGHAVGVRVERGQVVWAWDLNAVCRLRRQAEAAGDATLLARCDEWLEAEGFEPQRARNAIWDALEAGE